jgi:nitrate reductase / nitrite oxidoreductase, beta subunit
MLRDRQTSETVASPSDKSSRVNLLNWDGKGTPSGLFPPRPEAVESEATAGLTGGTDADEKGGPA